MVDIQTTGENGLCSLLLRTVPCQHVIFTAGGQLTLGTVYGIYFGSQFTVYHQKPQYEKRCGTDDGNHTGNNGCQASFLLSTHRAVDQIIRACLIFSSLA